MSVEISSKVKDNVLIAEITGDSYDGGDAGVWLSIFQMAQDAGTEGILLVNHLKSSISPVSALILNKHAQDYPVIKAIANYRINLPNAANMFVYTLMNRVAKGSGRSFRNFFSREEAEDWLQSKLKESREENYNGR